MISRIDNPSLNCPARKIKRFCVFEDLHTLDYTEALNLQVSTREKLLKDPARPDRVFFVQHPPVYTLGKRGGEENLVVSKDVLKKKGISIVQTDRGGNITYHGPGQAVLYPIVNLERARIGVADFVFGLEEIMKQTAAKYHIIADRDSKNHGLWVGQEKIGSVGLSIKKGISIHGLAMNIVPDLAPFTWINPCGLENTAMTSIQNELKKKAQSCPDPSMDQIRDTFFNCFCDIFNYTSMEENND
ncbi:MAG: lipoyl(octanoyl) transferase LipB [Desulfobacter sp.]|nr:lipoyl(octanoyl) transferase LipB [Desulfobacter sp.]